MDKPGTIDLGKQGENLSREIAFPEPAQWRGTVAGQAAGTRTCLSGGAVRGERTGRLAGHGGGHRPGGIWPV